MRFVCPEHVLCCLWTPLPGNPVPLFDSGTGRVILVFGSMTRDVMTTASTDLGASWSTPVPFVLHHLPSVHLTDSFSGPLRFPESYYYR